MKQSVSQYVLSFQTEPFHRKTRYHWMICLANSPDKLLSWGHAPTKELAEEAARNEVENLSSGLTEGGRVISTIKAFTNRC